MPHIKLCDEDEDAERSEAENIGESFDLIKRLPR